MPSTTVPHRSSPSVLDLHRRMVKSAFDAALATHVPRNGVARRSRVHFDRIEFATNRFERRPGTAKIEELAGDRSPDHVVIVGSRDQDRKAAQAFGCTFLWADRFFAHSSTSGFWQTPSEGVRDDKYNPNAHSGSGVTGAHVVVAALKNYKMWLVRRQQHTFCESAFARS